MVNLLQKILNAIFPLRESQKLLAEGSRLRADPKGFSINNLTGTCLLSYQDPLVNAAVKEAKFHCNQTAQAMLGTVLGEYIKNTLVKHDLIIPMPLSRKRRRERGHNQVESLLKAAGMSFHGNILAREERPPQSQLPRAERLSNVSNAFYVKPGSESYLRGARVLLVDDVSTTGATMAAARAALAKYHPASIDCLVLTH